MKPAKQLWQKYTARVDGLTLRERGMLFAMAAAVIIFLIFFLFLNPSYQAQKAMLTQMNGQEDRIAGVEAEIQTVMLAASVDPDAADKARLLKVRADAQALRASLMQMQQGMVPAERMSGLIERVLRSHRSLQLKSMRTMAPGEGEAAPAPSAGASPPPPQLLHKHGVQLVVQGNYVDLVDYMHALEDMQGQIFWGQAQLRVDTYPTSTLTLVMYTINLDQTWLTL